MFNVGGSEVLVIMLVALIVLGPKELPKVMQGLGKARAELKKYSTLLQREAESTLAPLRDAMEGVTGPIQEMANSITGPSPSAAPDALPDGDSEPAASTGVTSSDPVAEATPEAVGGPTADPAPSTQPPAADDPSSSAARAAG
ncbi:MAG TPA: twin-arginine translocase TatA/TatE family subunit [Acidimicrobiales bacterium]|jgi:sec-independent protein translocase protein TatB